MSGTEREDQGLSAVRSTAQFNKSCQRTLATKPPTPLSAFVRVQQENNVTQDEVLAFINANMSCTLATSINNKPHVRGMWMYRADRNGIVFHTGVMRDLYEQLLANPNIELCFHNNDPQSLMQVRVSGVAALEKDDRLREEIISQRPFLEPIVAEHGQDSIVVFRVKTMVASVWSMAHNLEPKEYVSIN